MKKILLITVLACAYSATFSQTSKFTLGIELKPTIAWLSGNSVIGIDKSRVGYGVGISSSYTINTHLGLKSGLFYERKGMKDLINFTDNDGNPLGSEVLFNNDYLILPILFSYNTEGDVKFYIDFGPYFGYLLKEESVLTESELYPEIKTDLTEYSKRFDFGVSIGSGISIPLNSRLLCDVGVKGDFGLMDTSNSNNSVITNGGRIIPNSIGLNVGIKYKI